MEEKDKDNKSESSVKNKLNKDEELIFNEINDICELKHKLDLSVIKINEKSINKVLKETPFTVPITCKKFIKEPKIEEQKEQEKKGEKFNCCQFYMFPSGITKKSSKKFETGEENNEIVDYSNLDEKVYNKFKKNPTRELDILIGNSGILFNSSPLMKDIVQKRISGYYLWDRMYIWQHYIKSLDESEKIKLMRNFLYRLKLFFERYSNELMNINQIKNAHKLLKKQIKNVYDEKEWDGFYLSSKMLGYNPDGTTKGDIKEKEKTNLCVLMEDKIKLNIKNELNGNGAGLILIKELSIFSNMMLYMKSLFEKVFEECLDILSQDFQDNCIRIHCIFFKYYDKYILSNSFMANIFEQLLIIYATYKQDKLVNFLHKLLIPKFNAFDELEKLEKSISKIIGNDIEYDEEKKIEKFQSVDELLKYIESDEQAPKKKKKKKKNNNPINQLEKLNTKNNFDDEPDIDIYEGKEIPDNISVMSGISEADSIVKAFKNDINNYNYTGEKVKPNLSDNFIYNLNEY